MIELCNSATKLVKKLVPYKCFEENFAVSENIFFLVIESKNLKALLIMAGKIPARKLQEKMKKEMEERDIFIAMMEEHPELFYDTSELDGLEDDKVTQKTQNEWIEEFVEKNCSEK